MKIAITGNTAGLGKTIHDRLREHEILEFSLDNNYDIFKKEDRQRIIDQCSDCDVFVNNAYYKWGQVDILFDLYAKWQNKNKTIINIGSVIGDTLQPWVHEYQIHKMSIDSACKQLQPLGKCKVSNIRLGFVDSPMVENWIKDLPKSFKILTSDQVADIVLYIINQPANICIKNISVEPWPSIELFKRLNPTAKPWLE